ncbi:fructuronate reductase [Arthrobacter silviterrae]|uniref:Mannitol dehydrogenase family protein n=1 Tax=Arthrobacter silviterrae TaxID=2026658 RepID=A0ABX0DE17_9MICC|nr:mannitol dehydrogenase family protein [Arthrobacter silviterrae]MDQ0278792.1 fructuronate reductase [Arthrobacter silviterrae]NGN83961.1 mannitol dehydrogenase family protein [Arthrobacter silviterrae]
MTHTSLPRLSLSTAGQTTARTAPAPGIVHLGLGNFHRAHQAVYTDAAIKSGGGDWGITGVSNRSSTVVDALKAQDMLYTVVEISPETRRFSVPRVHVDAFVAAHDLARVPQTIAAESTKIVSLTVTENGYTYSPTTGGLNLAATAVQRDLITGNIPSTTVGQIVRGLQRRMHTHGSPITVLSCDNLANNGHHTQLLVNEFVSHLPTAESSDLAQWIKTNTTFPSSMVDRIVPATTDNYREAVAASLGYIDAIPVPAEPFTMWVLEDNFAAGRPSWEAGGAIFSTEVDKYEQLKVRLLNGTHSLIAYLGALSGAATIPDAVAVGYIESAARSVLQNEYLPSVSIPSGVNVTDYETQLFSRWRNTALGHKTSQVGSDGSVKLGQRIPLPALELLAGGTMPQHLALTVAAYISCIAPLAGFNPGAEASAMEDPARPLLMGLAAESGSGRDLARKVLGTHHLLGEELSGHDDFINRTGDLIDIIHRHGPGSAARDALSAADPQLNTRTLTRN